jgi:hypothetical protein
VTPHRESLSGIEARLDRVRSNIRRLFLIDGTARLALAAVAFIIATFALDWIFHLPSPVRLVFLVGGGAALAWVALRRVIHPLGVGISDDDLALFIERRYPQLNDRLISAIQLARAKDEGGEDRVAGFNSPELVRELVKDAARASDEVDFNRVVVRGHVMKIAAWAAVALFLIAGVAAARADLAKIYAVRMVGGSAKWPRRTTLHVVDFDPVTRTRTFAKGDDVPIAIRAEGSEPRKVRFRYEFKSGEKGEESRELSGNLYLFQFTNLSGPFTFTAQGGDDETEVYTVLTQNPPLLTSQHAFIEYPEYLAQENTPADRPEQMGNLQVPLGSKIRLEAESNEDLVGAQLIVGPKGREKTSDLAIEKDAQGLPRRVGGSFAVEEALLDYEVKLTAKNSLENRETFKYAVRGLVDQKPAIQVFEPAGDENITDVCKRPIEITTSDDYGVAGAAMEARITGPRTTEWEAVDFGQDHNRPREYDRREKKVKSSYLLEVASLGAKEGEFVEIRFTARDFRTPEANVTTSRVFRFAVVSISALEKELQAAIDKIKSGLQTQHTAQRTAYDRAGATEKKFSATDRLGPEQQGEVRGLSFVQQAITEKLSVASRDIDRVRQRGLWNGVFDERSAAALEGAVHELRSVAPGPDVPNATAPSPLAGTLLVSAARENKETRLQLFGRIQALQLEVLAAIDRARRHLDHWANLQEIITMVREVKRMIEEAQKHMHDAPQDK